MNVHATRINRDNVLDIIADYDVIVDGADNFPTRYLGGCIADGTQAARPREHPALRGPRLGVSDPVVAARMAVEDAGGKVLGKPVDIVFADHQNKADVGINIARQWFEVGKVDMAIGFDNSAVALGVEQLAADHNKIAIAGAVGSTAFTGKSCTPTEASWIYDSYALTTSVAKSVVAEGRDSWFFITVDYAFGYSLEADATARSGGRRQGARERPSSPQHG